MGKKRNEYTDNLKWNVNDIYATKQDYEREYKKLEDNLKEYEKYHGHILDSANNLYELLKFDTNFSEALEKIYVYAHLQMIKIQLIQNFKRCLEKHINYMKSM